MKKIPSPIYKYTNSFLAGSQEDRVKKVRIKKETEFFVVDMHGHRYKKVVENSPYSVSPIWTDTPEECIEHIRSELTRFRDNYKDRYEYAEEKLTNFIKRVKEYEKEKENE